MALDEGDILRVTPRAAVIERPLLQSGLPPLATATLETARARAPGWDIYALEADWRAVWASSGRPKLLSPDKAFLGWLNKRLAG